MGTKQYAMCHVGLGRPVEMPVEECIRMVRVRVVPRMSRVTASCLDEMQSTIHHNESTQVTEADMYQVRTVRN